MGQKRTLTESSIGKHIGHAVEGHCMGMLRHAMEPRGYTVVRELPFDFPVHPDIVILNAAGKIKSLGIVAYSRDSKGTDKKFYRSRMEYIEILRTWRIQPTVFSSDFTPLIVIYGEANGWKSELLLDLANNCSPTLFLPRAMGPLKANRIVQDAFAVYRQKWETGASRCRDYVEDWFAGQSPDAEHLELASLLLKTLTDKEVQLRVSQVVRSLTISTRIGRVPEPFSSRIRQGLSMASLFPDEELRAWVSCGRSHFLTLTGSHWVTPGLPLFA